jgi:hypothetical protein
MGIEGYMSEVGQPCDKLFIYDFIQKIRNMSVMASVHSRYESYQ